MKIRKLYIDDFKIFRKFTLDFTSDGRAQGLIVIAGLNGSGKTTLLKDFIFHTFKQKKIPVNSFIEIEQREGGNGGVYKIDDERLTSDTSAPGQFTSPKPEYDHIIFHEAGVFDSKTAEETILQYVFRLIFEEKKKGEEAFAAVREELDFLFQDFDLQVEFSGINRKQEVLFKNSTSEEIGIEALSGGEKELIAKAFSLYLSDIKNSIILIDEPESSLHPNWQNRIAPIYQHFAEKNDNQIILATHSPHIAASVRKEQIRVLVRDEQRSVRAIDGFNGSYGWKIDKVLLEIFGVKELRTPFVEKQIDRLRDMVSADNYKSDKFNKLQKNLERIIGYGDMDLALIRMEIAGKEAEDEADHQKRT